jgi:hypothetical protein
MRASGHTGMSIRFGLFSPRNRDGETGSGRSPSAAEACRSVPGPMCEAIPKAPGQPAGRAISVPAASLMTQRRSSPGETFVRGRPRRGRLAASRRRGCPTRSADRGRTGDIGWAANVIMMIRDFQRPLPVSPESTWRLSRRRRGSRSAPGLLNSRHRDGLAE